MTALNNTKRTRFKLVVYNNLFFMALSIFAVYHNMEVVVTAAITQIGAVTLWYVQSETKRPSIKPE